MGLGDLEQLVLLRRYRVDVQADDLAVLNSVERDLRQKYGRPFDLRHLPLTFCFAADAFRMAASAPTVPHSIFLDELEVTSTAALTRRGLLVDGPQHRRTTSQAPPDQAHERVDRVVFDGLVPLRSASGVAPCLVCLVGHVSRPPVLCRDPFHVSARRSSPPTFSVLFFCPYQSKFHCTQPVLRGEPMFKRLSRVPREFFRIVCWPVAPQQGKITPCSHATLQSDPERSFAPCRPDELAARSCGTARRSRPLPPCFPPSFA